MTSTPRKPAPGVPNLASRPLTGREHAMAAPLAAWLLSEMCWRLRDGSPADDLLYDGAQPNLETGCAALERVGLTQAEAGYWRVLQPASAVLSLSKSVTRRELDTLLHALACHAPYVDALCPVGEPVLPDTDLLATLCEGLIACGYMVAETGPQTWVWSKPQDVLHWTVAFDPWLVCHGVRSLRDIPPANAAAVDAVLHKLPASAISHLSSRTCAHPPEFIHYFMASWVKGAWRSAEQTVSDPFAGIPESGWDLCLASALYARLHG